MGKAEDDAQYLVSQALQLQPKFQFRPRQFDSFRSKVEVARHIWGHYEHQIDEIVCGYSDEHLGKVLAASSLVGFSDIPLEDDREALKGRDLLVVLVCKSLVNVIAGRIWGELSMSGETTRLNPIKCRFCDFAVAKSIQHNVAAVSGFVVMMQHVSHLHPEHFPEIRKCLCENVTE